MFTQYIHVQEFEKTKNGADKSMGTDKPRPTDQQVAMSTTASALTMTSIPVAPPPALANPDKPVSDGGGVQLGWGDGGVV